MTDFISPVEQESTPSIVAEKLRQAIAYGALTPGTQLGEAELARKLGVSRGPLREGMQRLTQEGLLLAIRNRGVFVNTMDVGEIRDMYLAREAVERTASRQILQGDHVSAGDALLAVVDEMAAAKDLDEASEADMRFHEVLVELAGSPRLSRLHQTFLVETRMCVHALADTYDAPADRVSEHQTLAGAIRSGDVALTDKLMLAHMEDAVERLIARLPVG
ncbi:GntR family transcriptional regulator [Mycolicibacterium porcinum]|uniref:GntR family transcriptional regulator n=1 Tax=Mycolicibacterium porcinum TaxID=39693 RepID=UPI00080B8035|nr:GntR family transcriptional regulator [Mycolicibacterium porcinum]MBX8687230.1 FCD domain-containing protein [Mycobacterium sp. 20091114027_K0903767]OCB48767.1 GntR family transcriptional regulator [Mycolicibacterium vulneris]ODR16876.1 GntR family transcriptional regulator [Mycolicibacterium porcinum]TVY05807.1 GntR family transcriptional regulator [Mycolicibacterium porcinum]